MLALLLAVALQIPRSFAPSRLEITAGSAVAMVPGSDVAFPVDPDPDVVCRRDRTGWRCRGGWIEGRWVDELVAAVRAAGAPGLGQMGYRAGVARQLFATLRGAITASDWPPAQRSAGLRLATPQGLGSLLEADAIPTNVYRAGFLVRVRLWDRSGRVLTVESRVDSRPKLLPWTVTYANARADLWRASISTAIARMLPPGDEDRARLDAPQADDWANWFWAIHSFIESCADGIDPHLHHLCEQFVR